ncbi:MAG: DUF1893 domain-containing protein [Ruminiclostridium sp.]|nr:DUF1893 domain-containing protein [Ruminiclostridium sp.]
MGDFERAWALLQEEGFTCVLCSGDQVLTSRLRGVKPLLSWLDEGLSLKGFSAADKVVGKAVAFLYVLLGVKEVYAQVMSRPAKAVLEDHGIPNGCEEEVAAIRNRTNTGFCPMETAVWNISEPEKALISIRQKFKELNP